MRRFETKIILYWLSEGQTHFGMPRDFKSLALRNQNRVAFHSDSTLPPWMHHKWKKEMIDFVCEKTNVKSEGTNSLENPFEFGVTT